MELDMSAEPKPVAVVQRVIVTDVDMPIGAMMLFMIRWAIASVPAFIVIAAVVSFVGGGLLLVLMLLSGIASTGLPLPAR